VAATTGWSSSARGAGGQSRQWSPARTRWHSGVYGRRLGLVQGSRLQVDRPSRHPRRAVSKRLRSPFHTRGFSTESCRWSMLEFTPDQPAGWASTQDYITAVTGGYKGTGPAVFRLAAAVDEPLFAPVGEALAAGWLSMAKAHVIERAIDALPGDPELRALAQRTVKQQAVCLDQSSPTAGPSPAAALCGLAWRQTRPCPLPGSEPGPRRALRPSGR
jgi:hypothetical protein